MAICISIFGGVVAVVFVIRLIASWVDEAIDDGAFNPGYLKKPCEEEGEPKCINCPYKRQSYTS